VTLIDPYVPFLYDLTMVAMRQIREVGQRIGRRFHPQRVILFGSYAYGRPTEDSDVDLLVVMPGEGAMADQFVEIRMAIRPSFPMDLLVRTPEKLQERLDMGDSFVRRILDEGKVLYEAATTEQSRDAVRQCRRFRSTARQSFNLD